MQRCPIGKPGVLLDRMDVIARETLGAPAGRAAEVAWIAGVFLDPSSPDRGHALETLAGPFDHAVREAARLEETR